MPAPVVLVLSCEHAGNRIPAQWRPLFQGQRARLDSHRGYDIGALDCARVLARRLDTPLLYADTSRLLVDLNRSPRHPALFSDVTRALPDADRRRILARYYHPHRERVEAAIAARLARGLRVLHVAVHSFTPVLDGVERNADIALLYDPSRRFELGACETWRRALREDGDFVVRSNYPYRGVSDGLTRHLRSRFPASRYAGVELELNQRLLGSQKARRSLYPALVASLGTTLRVLGGSASATI